MDIKTDDQEKQEYFDYLEDLRESGETNMFGAGSYLAEEFGLTSKEASVILLEWMGAHRD